MRRVFLVCLLSGCGTPVVEHGAPPDPEPAPDPLEPAREAPAEPEQAQGVPEQDPSRETGLYMPGVPRYPNARYLCWQHVNATTAGHIMWRGYATSDDLATVRRFYESRFYGPAAAEGAVTFEPDGESFRLRYGRDRVVSAHAAGSGHPTCDVEHGPEDRTYIVVSSIAR